MDMCLHSVGCRSRSGNAGTQSVCSTLVSGYVNLYSLQQSEGVAPLTFQHLVLLTFSVLAILVSMSLYCIMSSVCFDLMTNEVERLLIHLLVT